eukprot:579086-Pleurochrysis_carterae.AAC.1
MVMIRCKEERTMRQASLCRDSSTVIPLQKHICVYHGKYLLYRLMVVHRMNIHQPNPRIRSQWIHRASDIIVSATIHFRSCRAFYLGLPPKGTV